MDCTSGFKICSTILIDDSKSASPKQIMIDLYNEPDPATLLLYEDEYPFGENPDFASESKVSMVGRLVSPNILAVNKKINREAYHHLYDREIRLETSTLGPLVFLLNRPAALSYITKIGLQLPEEYQIKAPAFKEICTFIAEYIELKTLRVSVPSSFSHFWVHLGHIIGIDKVMNQDWLQCLTVIKNLEALDIIFDHKYPDAYTWLDPFIGMNFVKLLRSIMLRPGSSNPLLSPHLIQDFPRKGWLYAEVSNPVPSNGV